MTPGPSGPSCVLLLGLLTACPVPSASVPELTEPGSEVEVSKASPPPNSREVGPVEGSHGRGCGYFGSMGTLEGATNALKNHAGSMQANYVEILSVSEPYSDGECSHNTFSIRGMAYRVPEAPSVASPTSVPAVATPTGSCDPPCSPGYRCKEGECIAVCNPSCSPGFTCNQRRICEPLPE